MDVPVAPDQARAFGEAIARAGRIAAVPAQFEQKPILCHDGFRRRFGGHRLTLPSRTSGIDQYENVAYRDIAIKQVAVVIARTSGPGIEEARRRIIVVDRASHKALQPAIRRIAPERITVEALRTAIVKT